MALPRDFPAVFVAVLVSFPTGAATLTVDPNGGADYTDIQIAIDAAETGDTVLARSGLYLVSEPLTFRGKAITVRSEEGAANTTIRRFEPPAGPEEAMVVVFRDGEKETSVLEGFTVAGYVEDLENPGGTLYDTFGGGILFEGDVSPTLRGCVVAGNAAQYGGGIACVEGSAPRILQSTVSWNTALGGGGVYVQDSSPVFEDCMIVGNVAEMPDTGGGGVLCSGSGSARFLRCKIAENLGGCGSAVHVDDASTLFENCTIFGHPVFAIEVGCGLCQDPMFVNCTISGNDSDGAICHKFHAGLFLNCILSSHWQNDIYSWGANLSNLSDKDPLFVNDGAFDFQIFAHGRWKTVVLGGRNIRVPNFILEEPDFHLQPTSPAIDAGVTEGASRTDFEGRDRPLCRGVDVGAYEFSECEALAAHFVRGDCNDDGDTSGVTDAVYLLSYTFLAAEKPPCLAACDANGDGNIGGVTDAVYQLTYNFLGALEPPPPFPDCGPESVPPGEALGCETPPANCR